MAPAPLEGEEVLLDEEPVEVLVESPVDWAFLSDLVCVESPVLVASALVPDAVLVAPPVAEASSV